ncbi:MULTISPECIES: hypothetical protein [unclassified Anaerobiospirillum]|uniref:hypothetical protein n=1 Tax=unclassified Anaerobiospirillum TaxID=2647410 RepID=UPI001FF194D3|nr:MULTISPECIES: hypothetical protein [unclassified Anaerobiospirillum]MCK0535722.1 hypothetical protein [Anaerobiospirillum sp. NML120511]MCK0540899.1 hypothetical protein [Anaerobiospirillum sp. NML02-A-032]
MSKNKQLASHDARMHEKGELALALFQKRKRSDKYQPERLTKLDQWILFQALISGL